MLKEKKWKQDVIQQAKRVYLYEGKGRPKKSFHHLQLLVHKTW